MSPVPPSPGNSQSPNNSPSSDNSQSPGKPTTRSHFKHTWRIPLALGCLILFGLLSALLGTGAWYGLSWLALLIPLAIIIWKISRQPR